MKINTTFGIDDYIRIVDEIVECYFDEDGNYVPHIGMIGVMEAFFNNCVSEYDASKDIDKDSAEEFFDEVFADEKFIKAFNEELTDCIPRRLNFGNAYLDAAEIIDDRKSSVQRIATLISSSLEKVLDPDTIAKIFGESERMKAILKGDDNVTSFIDAINNIQ